jgi:hypothetical protein
MINQSRNIDVQPNKYSVKHKKSTMYHMGLCTQLETVEEGQTVTPKTTIKEAYQCVSLHHWVNMFITKKQLKLCQMTMQE